VFYTSDTKLDIADAPNISFNYIYNPKALTKAISALLMAQ